jgi:hypothetical protein
MDFAELPFYALWWIVHPHGPDGPSRQGDVILPKGIYRVVKLMGDGSGQPLRWRPGDMPYILASPLGISMVNEQKVAGLASPPMW